MKQLEFIHEHEEQIDLWENRNCGIVEHSSVTNILNVGSITFAINAI